MADAVVDTGSVLDPLAASSIGSDAGPVGCIDLTGVVELNDGVLGDVAGSRRTQSGKAVLDATAKPEFAPYPWKMDALHTVHDV